jgi:hypothetical protein
LTYVGVGPVVEVRGVIHAKLPSAILPDEASDFTAPGRHDLVEAVASLPVLHVARDLGLDPGPEFFLGGVPLPIN